MRPICSHSRSAAAIFTLAKIKAAVEAFDQGDSNVFDVLEAITVAVEMHRATATSEPHRDAA